MDFERILRMLGACFAESGTPWAVIGGLAMVAYGLGRTTLDVDILVPGDDQERFVRFVEANGYETLHRSSGFSNHLHSDSELGRVDAVYVRGETAERMFANLRRVAGPRGLEIPVPSPEHLAAMKIFSISNDPRRATRELSDVRFLLGVRGVDRAAIEASFERYGLGALRERLDE